MFSNRARCVGTTHFKAVNELQPHHCLCMLVLNTYLFFSGSTVTLQSRSGLLTASLLFLLLSPSSSTLYPLLPLFHLLRLLVLILLLPLLPSFELYLYFHVAMPSPWDRESRAVLTGREGMLQHPNAPGPCRPPS